jgi:hypothetical protein
MSKTLKRRKKKKFGFFFKVTVCLLSIFVAKCLRETT